ncbi:MAG: LysM peptidoglycan-binding domain-containing protein [Puniceicoccales bacterium]|jgi:LysM repeat protein|nr:LysM peptidoglycan-binding domain-containing protein [Puniceicoccales bacterium]
MKPTLTIASVVIVHVAVIALIAGCQTESGHEKDPDTSVYSAGANTSGGGARAREVPVPATEETPPAPISGGGAHAPAPVEHPAPKPAQKPVRSTTGGEAKPAARPYYYTVRKGDSLSLIAKRQGVKDIGAIRRANNLPNDKIKPGQKLLIPGKSAPAGADENPPPPKHAQPAAKPAGDTPPPAAAGAGETVIHVVKRGDTLGGIAKRYHVTRASIRTANNLRGDNVVIGKKLKIPGAAARPAAGTPPPAKPDATGGAAAPAAPAGEKQTPPPPPPPAPVTGIGAMPDFSGVTGGSVSTGPSEGPPPPPPTAGAGAVERDLPPPANP